jgi:predicted Zn-ribbon and HTH transcriptional regulator
MRASLPHTLRERRRSRADQHRRAAIGASETARAAAQTAACAATASTARAVDPAAQRVRDAGGPIDEASYACHCGFVFRAPVSTTVACPHCRATQAW